MGLLNRLTAAEEAARAYTFAVCRRFAISCI
jgi:hypothetical protein